jgi:mono/diheme cytochrome c family protein
MSRIVIATCRGALVIGLATLFVSTVAARKEPATGPTGREIYMDRCGACHGEDGRGNGPAVGSLAVAPSDLTMLTKRYGAGKFPVEQVKQIVGEPVKITAHGSREMPIWGDLFHPKNAADQQTANERFKRLVEYLESIQQ